MRVPSTDTLGQASAAVAEPGNDVEYTYEIHVEAHTGLRRRWRGRLVTVDDAGMRRYGRWLSARTREQVVEALWNEAMFDIKYHVRHASAIVIGDPPL
jgi:endonuclease YncB( thermonuclease family)